MQVLGNHAWSLKHVVCKLQGAGQHHPATGLSKAKCGTVLARRNGGQCSKRAGEELSGCAGRAVEGKGNTQNSQAPPSCHAARYERTGQDAVIFGQVQLQLLGRIQGHILAGLWAAEIIAPASTKQSLLPAFCFHTCSWIFKRPYIMPPALRLHAGSTALHNAEFPLLNNLQILLWPLLSLLSLPKHMLRQASPAFSWLTKHSSHRRCHQLLSVGSWLSSLHQLRCTNNATVSCCKGIAVIT